MWNDPAVKGMILAVALWMGACSPAPEAATAPAGLATSFEVLPSPAGPGAMAPELTGGPSGVRLSWLEPAGSGDGREFRLMASLLTGGAWGDPVEIAAGDGFFANWADRPAVVESSGGALYGHWLEKLGDATYAYGVELARAAGPEHASGGGWQRLGLLHDDASPTEHGFVSYVASAGGVRAFWLDGRAMVDGGSMQLRTVLLGAGAVHASTVLDDRVCECCSTDAVLTSEGPIVVFRDRSQDETRNIAVVRATGDGWSEPRALHDDGWRIHGCPVNGPAIDADGGRVAVAWFTLLDEEPRIQVAFSSDAGASFREPVRVDAGRPLGRVDLALDGRGDAFVCWLGTAGDGAEVRVRRVTPGGDVGPVRVVARTTAKRSAGVPRMARDQDRLIFAWVEDRRPPTVATAAWPLAAPAAAEGTR